MEPETFEREADRVLVAGREAGVTLRLLGALAFRRRCPRYQHLQDRLGRAFTDIDFAGYGREVPDIRSVMSGLGYREDPGVYVESEGSRLIFEHPDTGLHADVFLDKLEFCHTISWDGRLEVDEETIPLAELVLEKMQIVEINEKDVIDTIMLLLEHPLADHDREAINIGYVAHLCARDWGLWRTLTMNLGKVRQLAEGYELEDGEKATVGARVGEGLQRIEREPKSRKWKLRAVIGDRKKWYRDVGELGPMPEGV
ncbi:MAG: hypothetical protein M3357_18680 [Actinomycetota bacterium]|nr:hypothetical protein [Actinomycetota bacterium]